MRAAVFDRFGPPDVLRLADLPDPEPAHAAVESRHGRGKVVLIVE